MSGLSAARDGSLHRGLVGGRTCRFLAVELAALADLARERHQLGPEATRLNAEAMVATALMSAWVKGRERVTLQIQAERPAFAFMGDADADGGMRARFHPGHVVGAAAGVHGLMLGIRADAQREIYRGVSALDGRTLEAALGAHVRGSEQMDAVLRLGARLDPDGRVAFAGGLLVERLPPEADLPSVSHEAFAATYAGLAEGDVEDLLVALAFGKIAGQEVEPLERRALQWRCSCSQERVEGMLRQLGLDELRQMREEDHGAEVTCHFCNLVWQVDEPALDRIIASFA